MLEFTKLVAVLSLSIGVLAGCSRHSTSGEISLSDRKKVIPAQVAENVEAVEAKQDRLRDEYRNLLYLLSGATTEGKRVELEGKLTDLRQEMGQLHQELAQQREDALSPEEKNQREQQRIERQQFMEYIQTLPAGERRIALMQHRLRQNGLKDTQISEKIEQFKAQQAAAAAAPAVNHKHDERAQAFRRLMEQYKDADPEVRRQVLAKWKEQQRNQS